MDAFRGEVFYAVYDREGRALGEPTRGAPEKLAQEAPDEAAFVGEGAIRYAETIRSGRPRARFPHTDLFLAGTLGRLAEPRLRSGHGVAASALRPLYLRDADIRSART
jgi:tRNA A37 threonylcarbamoyladenosine modification protein TsaB